MALVARTAVVEEGGNEKASVLAVLHVHQQLLRSSRLRQRWIGVVLLGVLEAVVDALDCPQKGVPLARITALGVLNGSEAGVKWK